MPGVTGCIQGHPANQLSKCKFYSSGVEKKNTEGTKEKVAQLIPWAGISLGQRDVADLAASRSLAMIGIIGVQNSGKTTLLTLLYCLLRRGHKIGEFQFAGSYTIPAWENLAYYMTWKPGNHISFPPHTPGSTGRIPGLLHLSLRDAIGNRKDLLLTDAKGEWFGDWAGNINLDTAASPIWIHQNSKAFVLVADCDELSGPNRGLARDSLKSLYNRIADDIGDRSLSIAWTKSDIELRPLMEQNLREHFNKDGLAPEEFRISALKDKNPEDGEDRLQKEVLSLFAHLIDKINTKQEKSVRIDSDVKDHFFSIRY